MKIWYSCKVKYSKENDEGIIKQVTEAYLVDAVSYTDAESRIYEAMERDISGEFQVTTISKTNISEVINEGESDDWYKSKVTYSTVDGDSEKEVKINTYFLVRASDIKNAFDFIETSLNSMLVPYEVPSITKTNIIDIYPYEGPSTAGLTPLSEVEQKEEEEA